MFSVTTRAMPTVLVALVLWTGNSRAQDRPATFVATDTEQRRRSAIRHAVADK